MPVMLSQAKASPASTLPVLATGLQRRTAMPLLRDP